MSALTFAALADVLEPDPDDEPTRASAPPSPMNSQGAVPVSIRAPQQVQDFAFAETVSAREIGEDSNPSTPIFFDDVAAATQHCVTPLAFPLPPAADDVDLRTRLRVGSAHVRHGLRGSIEDMSDLWRGAGEIVEAELMEGFRRPPATALGLFLRRVRAAWSCFTWTSSDLARVALIFSGVFLVGVTAVLTTRANNDDATATASSDASTEVRAPRTVEQHTGRKLVVRNKR